MGSRWGSETANSGLPGLPWWLSGGDSARNSGDQGSIPESGMYNSPAWTISTFTRLYYSQLSLDFPGGASGKELACWRGRLKRPGSPGPGPIPWRRGWKPSLVLLPRECQGQRSLAGAGLRVTQSGTRLTWLRSSNGLTWHFRVFLAVVCRQDWSEMQILKKTSQQIIAILQTQNNRALN